MNKGMNELFIWVSTHWTFLVGIFGGIGAWIKLQLESKQNTNRIDKLEKKLEKFDTLVDTVDDLEKEHKEINTKLDKITDQITAEFRKFDTRLTAIETLIKNSLK